MIAHYPEALGLQECIALDAMRYTYQIRDNTLSVVLII